MELRLTAKAWPDETKQAELLEMRDQDQIETNSQGDLMLATGYMLLNFPSLGTE